MDASQEHKTEWEQLLEFYHVDSVEQLVTIMQSSSKSSDYHSIKDQTMDSLGVTNLKTAYQQKRQMLSALLHNKNRPTGSRKGSAEIVMEKQLIKTSHHSYEELISYFQINKNPQNIKKIVRFKYQRCEIVRTHRFRKQLWGMLTGFANKQEEYPNLYAILSKYENYQDFFGRIIHADVIRTIHDNDHKFKEEIIAKMEKLLFSFARRNPYIGYCQGMNFILNFIITMQFSEEECFWLFVTVLEEIIPFSYYTNMSGVAADIKILEHIFREVYPKSAKKLAAMEVQPSVFMLEWLVCIYTSTLPFYLLIIVWDFLLLEGSMALLKVAMILMQQLSPLIETAVDFPNFFQLYEEVKKKLSIDEQSFLKKYNSIYLDPEVLRIVRKLMQFEVKMQKEELRKNMDKKDKQRWREGECDVQWPICFHQLRKHKQDDEDIEVWVFKDENGPRLISDYLDLRNRKSYKVVEDNRQESKKLMIGRIPHICDFHEYKKKQEASNRGRELEEFQLGIRRFNKNLEGVFNFSAPDFFRRVTANSYAFARLSRKP